MEKYNFAIAKRWIEGEGHSYVLIFTANVLHGSWVFVLHYNETASSEIYSQALHDAIRTIGGQTLGYDGSCAFLPLACERALLLLN